MSPFVLSVLKYALLVLLYFFVFRAVRSVAVDLRGAASPRGGRSRSTRAATAEPTRGGKPPSQVVVHDGEGGRATSIRLSGSMDIGRAEACAIRLTDTYVSQVHARLVRREGTWYVEDAGSTNGTFLNDQRVAAPVPVHAGDVVKVGTTVLELRR